MGLCQNDSSKRKTSYVVSRNRSRYQQIHMLYFGDLLYVCNVCILCILCMYSMFDFYLCIRCTLCMYPMYVFQTYSHEWTDRKDGAISELLFFLSHFILHFFINQMKGTLQNFCSFGPWPGGWNARNS